MRTVFSAKNYIDLVVNMKSQTTGARTIEMLDHQGEQLNR